MAEIIPFRGIRYQAAKAGGALDALAAPPYDIISPAEQAELYERSPYNIVRLILGRETDKYAQAAQKFGEWRQAGVLVTDDTPCFYLYRQTFADPVTGAPLPERLGLVCLLKLEDYDSGKVLRHEHTLTGPKADRLDLLRATHAQFESIYGLYSDPDHSVESFLQEWGDRENPLLEIKDAIGSSHTIERLADDGAIQTLQELMRDKPMFIADGHHRYETALNFKREANGLAGADYILVTLTAFEDEGLLVLPTHRLIKGVDPVTLADLPLALSPLFTITPAAPELLEEAIADAAQTGHKAFGLLLPGSQAYLLTLNADAKNQPGLVPGPQSEAVKRLDVTLLHSLILEQQLGITPAILAAGEQIAYTRDPMEAMAQVNDRAYQAAFLLGRPSVADVRDVSLAGDVMPQKSTFFFPKLLSGLLLRDLTDDPAEASHEN